MIWLYLFCLFLSISYLVRGNKMMNKAMLVQDVEERVALMKRGKRLQRAGQILITLLLIIAALIVSLILYLEYF